MSSWPRHQLPCASGPESAEDLLVPRKKSAPCCEQVSAISRLSDSYWDFSSRLLDFLFSLSLALRAVPPLGAAAAQLWDQAPPPQAPCWAEKQSCHSPALLPGDAGFPPDLPLLLATTLASDSPSGCQEHPRLLQTPVAPAYAPISNPHHRIKLNTLLNRQMQRACVFAEQLVVLFPLSCARLPSSSCKVIRSEVLMQRFQNLSWVISVQGLPAFFIPWVPGLFRVPAGECQHPVHENMHETTQV